jgi:L-seryl-tRNA(Ser) seleniumtransferase
VHRSNFFMGGFVESPSAEELAAVARKKRVPFVEDLGSGAIINTEKFGALEHEPTPAEVLRRGCDLVCFSGDKLFGGPQAGIIAGKEKLVGALKKEPFFRALRCDKLILGALQRTAELYLSESHNGVGILELLAKDREQLEGRATRIIEQLQGLPLTARLGEGRVQIGGGTLPKSVLPSITIDLVPGKISLEELAGRLRRARPPIIGYVAAQRYKIDLKTVFPRQDEELAAAIRAVLGA